MQRNSAYSATILLVLLAFISALADDGDLVAN